MVNGLLSNTRIVLVNTSHPGNIGSCARAMKTMGLSALYLVAPQCFPHPKANELASNAVDILEQAVVVDDVDAAVKDCGLVVGTSTRSRKIPWPILNPREFAEHVRDEAKNRPVAVLFGREQSGLTNDELHRCHLHVQIPTSADYSSLNLAAAVQVVTYELHMASLTEVDSPPVAWDFAWATAEQMERFYQHLEQVLVAIDFLDPKVPRQLMTRLRRLFYRAQPDVMEMNILRGILGMVEKKIRVVGE